MELRRVRRQFLAAISEVLITRSVEAPLLPYIAYTFPPHSDSIITAYFHHVWKTVIFCIHVGRFIQSSESETLDVIQRALWRMTSSSQFHSRSSQTQSNALQHQLVNLFIQLADHSRDPPNDIVALQCICWAYVIIAEMFANWLYGYDAESSKSCLYAQQAVNMKLRLLKKNRWLRQPDEFIAFAFYPIPL